MYPGQSDLGTCDELYPDKPVNFFASPKFTHEGRKSLRLRVSGKHCIIDYRQGRTAALDELAYLGNPILEKG